MTSPDANNRSPGFANGEVGRDNHESDRPFQKILVPTDFSPCSARAIERAMALAGECDAVVTLLHVVDVNSPAAFAHCGTADELMGRLWATGVSGLRRLAETLAQTQTSIRTLIVEGFPAEAIIEHSSGFDLLVIAEPRSKSAWSLFSKHTVRRVIEQARCPVEVVQQQTPQVAGGKLETQMAAAACSHPPHESRRWKEKGLLSPALSSRGGEGENRAVPAVVEHKARSRNGEIFPRPSPPEEEREKAWIDAFHHSF